MPRTKKPKPKDNSRKAGNPLRLHPEILKAADSLPGLHDVKAVLVRAEPSWRRWAEGMAINFASALIGGLFTAYFLTAPAAQPTALDERTICPSSPTEIDAAMLPLSPRRAPIPSKKGSVPSTPNWVTYEPKPRRRTHYLHLRAHQRLQKMESARSRHARAISTRRR